MALVKLAAGIVDISGKFGGVYFSRDLSGLHVRRRTITGVGLPTQVPIKFLKPFWTLMSIWALVGPVVTAQWAAYAATQKWKNKVGSEYHPTGWQTFIKHNHSRVYNGLEAETTPPWGDHID